LISIKIPEALNGNMARSKYLWRNNGMRMSTWLATALLLASAGAFAASSVDLYKDPG
jgi:hypothetical protein